MGVPLPPMSVPMERVQARAFRSTPMVAESEVMTGTMVAAKGMLSTKAEAMPDSHRMMMTMRVRLPPVMWAMPWAMASSTPVCSRPLTARSTTSLATFSMVSAQNPLPFSPSASPESLISTRL